MKTFEELYQTWEDKGSAVRVGVTEPMASFQNLYTAWQNRNGKPDINTVGQQVTDRVSTWMEDHNDFLSGYNDRFAVRKGDFTDGYVTDSQNYLDTVSRQTKSFDTEANAIKGILGQYGSYLNPEWVSAVTKALDDAKKQQDQIRQAAQQDASFWAQFEDEEDYKAAGVYDRQSKLDLTEAYADIQALREQVSIAKKLEEEMYLYFGRPSGDVAAMAKGKALQEQLKELTAQYGGIQGMEKALEEKEDYYDTAKSIQLYNEQRKADIPKLSAELENLQGQLEAARQIQAQIAAFNPYAYADSASAVAAEKALKAELAQMTEPWGGMKGLEAAFSEKESYYNTAKRYQDWEKLGNVVNNADFEAMSGYKSTEYDKWHDRLSSQYSLGYKDVTYEYINGDQVKREEILRTYANFAKGRTDSSKYTVFDNMTDKEIATYNYHYNTGGKEKADEYLRSITEELNYRKAEQQFERMEGKPLAEILYGIPAGADQFKSGMQGLWNSVTGKDTYIPASTTQILGGMAREDLSDNGWKLPEWAGGSSLGQMAYDLLSTTTNMAPSLAVSAGVGLINPTAGAVAGAGLMGVSAAGNAYTEMINQGYSKEQARAYSTLVGSSEAGLSYLLGGIGKLGGKVSGNMIGKIVDKVDGIFTKVSIKLGGKMLSEGMEEGLQEVLTPWFKEIATNIEQDINWEEAAYSGLLGSLTGLVMEGKGTVKNSHSSILKDGETAGRTDGEKNPTGAGGVKYSLMAFEKDGRRFVDIQMDENTFDGMTIAEMNRAAKAVLMDKFAGKVIGIDNRVFVNGDSVNEYLHPSKDIDADIRRVKLTASGELDNLLDAGVALPNEPDGKDGHYHPDAIDFSYYKTVFKVGSEYFEGIVNIKNIKRGKLLKDITKIRNITKDIVSSYGDNPKSNFLRDASMNSIRNSGEVVNIKGSFFGQEQKNPNEDISRNWVVDGRELVREATGPSITVDGKKYQLLGYDAKGSPVYEDARVVQEHEAAKAHEQDTKNNTLATPGELGEKAIPYSERGIELEPRVKAYLNDLKADRDYIERAAGEIQKQDLAVLTAETGVEYTLLTVGNKEYLIRGQELGTTIPQELADAILQEKGVIACHSHPFIGDLSPSESDLEFIKRLTWQKDSVIVDPTQRAVRFTADGSVEVFNLINTRDGDYYNKLFGGGGDRYVDRK